jgi:hypothetical protein
MLQDSTVEFYGEDNGFSDSTKTADYLHVSDSKFIAKYSQVTYIINYAKHIPFSDFEVVAY